MKNAASIMSEKINIINFKLPKYKIISNVTANYIDKNGKYKKTSY